MAKKVSSKKSSSGKASRSKKVKKVAKKAAAKKPIKKKPKKAAKRTAKKAVKKPAKKVKKATPTKKLTKSPLTKPQLARFRTILLQKRRDLVGDMTGIEAEALKKGRQDVSSDLSTLPTHPADIGTDNYEQEFTLGLLDSERQMLREIEEALVRIENGIYGICFGTGKAIGKPRLRARPWARYCIEYARLIEKGLVRPQLDDEEGLFGDTDKEDLKDELDEEGDSDTEPEDDVDGEDEDS